MSEDAPPFAADTASAFTPARKNARPREDRPVCAGEEGEANLVSQLSKD